MDEKISFINLPKKSPLEEQYLNGKFVIVKALMNRTKSTENMK